MLPKDSKHFIVPTADELDVDSKLVESAVSFYYSTLRKGLSDLKCPYVQVESLGLFKTKERELPKLYAKYTKHLTVLTKETFVQMTLKKEIQSKLDKVIAVQDLIKADKARKEQFLKDKNDNIRENLESPETDN